MNEIIWSYRTGGASKKHFSKKHDVILFYSKSNKCIFNLQKEKSYTKSESRKPGLVNYGAGTAEFFQDEHGVYNLVNCRDVWKISYINSQAKERLGYPTQKPEALLERIIKASSNEGDIVLDPFCGCGTAVAVAHKLNRRFVGIDISSFTIDLIMQKRLHGIDVHVGGMPSDFSSAMKLASENPYNFEAWAITRVPGLRPNTKRGSDGGTDGRGRLAGDPSDWGSRLVLAQVKGVKMFQLSALRDFMHVIDRDKAALGVFITLHRVNSRDAHAEAAGAGQIHLEGNWFPRMQLWSIEQFFDDPQVLPKLPTMMEPYTNKPLYPNLFSQP